MEGFIGTREEILLISHEAEFNREKVFCPLIKGPCNKDCECLEIAAPVTVEKGAMYEGHHDYKAPKYKVGGWACGNSMFTTYRWSDTN